MKHIFELTREELYTIAEIVTGYPCDKNWDGLIEKRPKLNPSDTDIVYIAWFVETYNNEISHFQIYIKENYDIQIGDVFNDVQHDVKNIVKYVKYIRGVPDWNIDAENLNLL
jgi:hypothetical protein